MNIQGRPVHSFDLHGVARDRPLQTWKTFLCNHMEGIASIDRNLALGIRGVRENLIREMTGYGTGGGQ
jgi:hypothetical protein